MGRVCNCLSMTILVVALGLGGCTTAPKQSEGAATAPATGTTPTRAEQATALPAGEEAQAIKDQSRWTLPLDPYWAPRTKNLQIQASQLVMASCMKEAGFPQYVMSWDMNAPWAENLAGNGITNLFNEESAAKYGYHQAPDPRDGITEKPDDVESITIYDKESPEFWEQVGTCEEQVGKELKLPHGPGSSGEEQPTDGIKSQMNQLFLANRPPEVIEAATKWRACMAPKGIADLPEEPWEAGVMLPESLAEQWEWWRPAGEPRPEEIELATFDAQCRRSSGWFDAYYDALWDLEENFIAEHKTDLAPLLELNKEDAKRYEEIIKKYSGE